MRVRASAVRLGAEILIAWSSSPVDDSLSVEFSGPVDLSEEYYTRGILFVRTTVMLTAVKTGWMDPAEYSFCAELEAAYSVVLAELQAILSKQVWLVWKEGPFTPTLSPTRINDGAEPCWRLFGLFKDGLPIPRHWQLCPNTAQILSRVPKLTKAGFACLEAGYVMEPHIGHDPRNYRVHLGLIIPKGDCGMRVGGETRHWTAGKVTMFDDNQIHEAWNRTTGNRFVLIVDVASRSEAAA